MVWAIELRRIRLTGHIASMEEIRNASITLIGNRERKRSLERPVCRGEKTLKWIFEKCVVRE
jgi:hypothetical protein